MIIYNLINKILWPDYRFFMP